MRLIPSLDVSVQNNGAGWNFNAIKCKRIWVLSFSEEVKWKFPKISADKSFRMLSEGLSEKKATIIRFDCQYEYFRKDFWIKQPQFIESFINPFTHVGVGKSLKGEIIILKDTWLKWFLRITCQMKDVMICLFRILRFSHDVF